MSGRASEWYQTCLCHVVVLTGIELIFSALNFRFVTKTPFIISQCFSYCWTVLTQYSSHFCFPDYLASNQDECAQKWRDTAGTADPKGPKECPRLPYDMMLSSKRLWGRELSRAAVAGSLPVLISWWWAIFLGLFFMTSFSWLCFSILLGFILLIKLSLSREFFEFTYKSRTCLWLHLGW